MQTTTQTEEPIQLNLEYRQCHTCSNKFKVLTTSNQTFCNKFCQDQSKSTNPKPKKQKDKPWESLERDKALYGEGVKTKPSMPVTPQVDLPKVEYEVKVTPKTEPKLETDPEETWDKYVREAKSHVKVMNHCRMNVAEIAMKACDIKWGGGDHWTGHKHIYTLKKFAEEVGVHYKTLNQWCRVKVLVKDKLPEGVWADNDYTAALRTQKKVNRTTDSRSLTKTYKSELSRDRTALDFIKSLTKLKFTRHLVCRRADLSKLDRAELTQMRDLAEDIHQTLTDFLSRSSS